MQRSMITIVGDLEQFSRIVIFLGMNYSNLSQNSQFHKSVHT
jgi:hypothetical protein